MNLQSTLLRCPGCGTVFRGPASLPAHGRVHCGVCGEVFAADASLQAPPSADTGRDSSAPRPAYASPAVAPLPGMGASLLRGALAVVLLLVLLGQLLWLGRNRLADFPSLRPVLEAACERFGCHLPGFRDLQAIHVSDARVTSHPDYAEALLAVVALNNSAPLAQPWPRLALVLTGADEAAIAGRLFEPADYLPAQRQADAQFAAGTTVEVRLPLADPGTVAAGFRFTLR
jgi:hypothetical protein